MEGKEIVQKIEEIRVLLGVLIEKTQETNQILRSGVKTQFGHSMASLNMDPDRFRKSEAERQVTKPGD